MRIFAWSGGPGGCEFYRLSLPLTELANQGHEVILSSTMPRSVRDGDMDVLVAQRTCEPGPSAVFQKMAEQGDTLCVMELDDDFWSITPDNKQAYGFYNEDRLRRMQRNIECANLVTASTSTLAEKVSRWNSNVVVLPNCVPAALLDHERIRNDRVTIGWAGSPSHLRDYGELRRPLRSVIQQHHDAVEYHGIGPDFGEGIRTPRAHLRHTGWFQSTEAYLRAIDFDIGLAPLRPSPFNDSKSAVKLLEYSALGIPSIVSDTGPYIRAMGSPESMAPALAAVTHKEWRTHLVDLITDTEAREQLGKQAREWAAGRTIEAHAHRWADAYEAARH